MVGAAAVKKASTAPSGLPAKVTALGTFFLDLTAGVDIDSERKRLTKDAQSLEGIIRGIKAPENVVAGAKKQLTENQVKLQETQDALLALQ